MIITQSPLRVSFFGGGTDFPEYYEQHGGCVLSLAINKYMFVVVKPRFDSKVRLTYTKNELVKSSQDLKHDILRECLKHVGLNNAVEVITIGDVPAGTGLGSSSAVTVGALKALYLFSGQEITTQQLAQSACIVEREILHKTMGVQDQYISAYGGFRFFEFNSHQITNQKLPVGNLAEHLLLFFTGITRDSGTILRVQKNNLPKRLEVLKKMKILAYKAVSEIENNNYDAVGKLLDQTWQLKKKLAKTISNTSIDRWYQKAKTAGALGGKILGAGGGGFLLFYCPQDKKNSVRKALSDLLEIPISPEPDGAKVILNYRT